MTVGVLYYSDCRPDPVILQACRDQIVRALHSELPVLADEAVAVTLKPLNDRQWQENIVLPLERGPLTMFRQILAGLEALSTDRVFFCEHDVLYHPSHFYRVPNRDDVFAFNQHVYKVDARDGKALHYMCNQTSGLCASRALLLEHYRKRVAMVEAGGFSMQMGYEPGTHHREGRVDDYGCETWMAEFPNVDIRHDTNLTRSRWSKDEFRNQRYTEGWTGIVDRVPGWPGIVQGRFNDWLCDAVGDFARSER